MWIRFSDTTRRNLMIALFVVFSTCSFPECGRRSSSDEQPKDSTTTRNKIKPLPGTNDTLLAGEVEQGQVLIAYSDCYTCHALDTKAKGPAFRDIAKRYPANAGYIELLAQKIIVGGSGVWGYPAMTPHPDLSVEHARLMAKYILSLER